MVAAPWFFAANPTLQGRGGYDIDRDIPLWVAVGALGLHGFGLLLRFLAEYSFFWGSDPKLGPVIAGAYDSDIRQLKKAYSARKPSTMTYFVHERKAWEYVARAFARSHKFDAVFRANRYGSIFHYIQTGLAKGSHWAGDSAAFDYWGFPTDERAYKASIAEMHGESDGSMLPMRKVSPENAAGRAEAELEKAKARLNVAKNITALLPTAVTAGAPATSTRPQAGSAPPPPMEPVREAVSAE